MRKYSYSFLFITSLLLACNEAPKSNNSELVSTDIIKNPRSASGDDLDALAKMGKLQFKDTTHNFGDIKEGDIVVYDFEYTNIGQEPILITEAKASCGCTVPEYDHNPILPNGVGSLKISFDSKGKPGLQAKKISVYTNGNPKEVALEIFASVK